MSVNTALAHVSSFQNELNMAPKYWVKSDCAILL